MITPRSSQNECYRVFGHAGRCNKSLNELQVRFVALVFLLLLITSIDGKIRKETL